MKPVRVQVIPSQARHQSNGESLSYVMVKQVAMHSVDLHIEIQLQSTSSSFDSNPFSPTRSIYVLWSHLTMAGYVGS